MFKLCEMTDEELNTLIDDILVALNTGVAGIDPRVDEIMKTQIGPFMVETVQEILILRLKLRNAEEIKELQKNLLDQYAYSLNGIVNSI